QLEDLFRGRRNLSAELDPWHRSILGAASSLLRCPARWLAAQSHPGARRAVHETAVRTISAMRFSALSSIESKYHAAGISAPSAPPAGWSSTFSVRARLTRSSERSVTSAGELADRA